MARKREQVFEVPVIYCRDDADVQRFVEERTWDFGPCAEGALDLFEAARAEFGDLKCFYLEIQPH